MKYVLGLLGVIVAAAIFVPSAQASSDRCSAADRCTATTADSHVDLAAVRTGKFTRGVWRLSCHRGSQSSVQRGGIGRNAKRLITPELSNATCTLVARGFAQGKIARVGVALR